MVKMPKKVIFLLIVFVAVGLLLLFSAMTANRTARKAISAPTFILYPVEKQPQSFDFSKTQSANFPKVLPAYKVEKKGLTGSEAASILQFFNITSRPRFINNNSPDGPQYSWEEKEASLSLSLTTLSFESLAKNSPVQALSEEQLSQKAASYIRQIPLAGQSTQNLAPSSPKTTYLQVTNDQYQIVDSFAASTMVEFAFEERLNNLAVVGQTPSIPMATVRMTKDGSVRMLYLRFFKEFAALDSYRLKSVNEAKREVTKGQGKIVDITTVDENGRALTKPSFETFEGKTVKISQIRLAYFLPENLDEPVQPIFVFEGEFEKDGESGKIAIYLPAIKN